LFQTAFEDAGDALFRGELDPRWLMGLWDEWASVVRNSAKGKDGSSKDKSGSVGGGDDDDAPVMVDVYAGLLADLEKLKGTTIKQIGLYFPSCPHHHSFTRTHALSTYIQWNPTPTVHTYIHSLIQRFSRACP
jgi:hypothetical protein